MSLQSRFRNFEERTRPVDPDAAAALARRWETLPERNRVPGQMLGRKTTGCEATHGVFPKCNFSCKPCYHSADANKVRVDGPHTLKHVKRQMKYLSSQRGWGTYTQLIGGEVSLLEPEDHAAAIATMRAHGRIPMSFTHGDFDYDYLRAIALDENGEPRFPHLSFAAHFDTTMVGRKGIKKPQSEQELHEYRERFCDMFNRLEDEYGITHYLAHNMTVTPQNLDDVADIVSTCHSQGWRMFSFQPAAYIGNELRWADGYRELTSDAVWGEVERGAGTTLGYNAMQVGDTRCNRVTWGAYLGDRYVPLLDDDDPLDHQMVANWYDAFPGNFILRERGESAARILRCLASKPAIVPEIARFAKRFAERGGGVKQRWWEASATTFVMHQFIDAADTAAGWEHIQNGTRATDDRILEAQERLEACAYTMGHPDTDQLIPACVQHGILDPLENRELATLLPLPRSKSESKKSMPATANQ